MIKKTDKGWLVDVMPGGRCGRRIRKTFSTKAEAERFKAHALTSHASSLPWNPRGQDKRRLSDLCKLWYALHGHTLKDGEGRLNILLLVCKRLKNPVAARFTSKDFAHYRAHRLEDGANPNTVNHEHAYLRAVFNELSRLGEWEGPNPVAKMRRLKFRETELTFLSLDQIEALLFELRNSRNADAYHVAKLCLATGARWSEAETLRAAQVQGSKVVFEDTKSGARRAVPVDPALIAEVMEGRKRSGRLFSPCYGACREAVERAGIELPDGQLTHVLRHTFSSHFMMNGGDILTLQRVLGHSSLTVTQRYAHLAPGHLEQVLHLNPLQCGLFVDNTPPLMGSESAQVTEKYGGSCETRTHDQRIKRPLQTGLKKHNTPLNRKLRKLKSTK